MKKTELFKKEIDWLGYHIDENGISPKQSKTEAILAVETPKRLRDVRSFLSSVQYLGKFIKGLTDLTGPLRKLTEKAVTKWDWTVIEQTAFDKI